MVEKYTMTKTLEAVEHPENFGFSAKRLSRITTFLQKLVDRNELAGMIATITRHGQSVFYNKIGWMDLESRKPMQDDTIFMIASMTKPVTAVAAMMLYEYGYFHLNTPVTEFIPAFKDTQVFSGFDDKTGEMLLSKVDREITLRHLFTHTSGLSYGWNENDPVDQCYRQAQQESYQGGSPLTNQTLVDSLTRMPLAFQPGTHWRYSLSIDIIGAIIEIISGYPLDRFLREKVFEPLEMEDTGFYVRSDQKHRVARVYGCPAPGDRLKWMEQIKPEFELPSFVSGGGGLVSTVGDYSRFCQMLVNRGEYFGNRLLSPKTVDLFRINHCPVEALPFYFEEDSLYHAGYGYSLGTRVLMDIAQSGMAGSIGEFGWDGAFRTYFWIDPVEELVGLLMLQYSTRPDENFVVHQQFKQLAYQAMS
jgi:CubicO group peptidase (beta-lactamase class C family)